MNIIVLTSAMIDDEFNQYAKIAKVKPNPSNQNFYSKLIKALSYYNNVSVLSLRPLTKGALQDQYLDSRVGVDGTIHYYYPHVESSKMYKLFKQEKEIVQIVDEIVSQQHYDRFIIVVDILRYSLLKAAKRIKAKYNMPIVGVVTDNAANLSNTKTSYVRAVKINAANLDGYIALSEDLNKNYNASGRPHYILEGLVDDVEVSQRLTIDDYYFFGGALYERYGVRRLVDAFHKSSSQYKLVIAGHGDLANYIDSVSKKDNRILYVAMVDKKTMYGLEQNAIANINPRPYSIKLDKESVPSKLLEYFASGTPTITTMHTKLHEIFNENAIWLMNDTESAFVRIFNTFNEYDYKELKKSASTARLKVYELYGLKNQGEGITHFLSDLVSTPSID